MELYFENEIGDGSGLGLGELFLMGDCGRGDIDKRRLRGGAWDRLGTDGFDDGDEWCRSMTRRLVEETVCHSRKRVVKMAERVTTQAPWSVKIWHSGA